MSRLQDYDNSVPRYCKSCGYDLRGSDTGRCSECGRTFDPRDERSYSRHQRAYSVRRLARFVGVCVVASLVGLAFLLILEYVEYTHDRDARNAIATIGGSVQVQWRGPWWSRIVKRTRWSFLFQRIDRVVLAPTKPMADDDLEHFRYLQYVTELDLAVGPGGRSMVSDKGLRRIGEMRSLRQLWLPQSNRITDAGMEHIARLHDLETLSLPRLKVSDDGVRRLANLRHLRKLNLEYTDISDSGIECLANCGKLEELLLTGTRISGTGLRIIPELLSLSYLNVGNTSVSDEDLKFIAKSRSLKTLVLTDTKVSEVGVMLLNTVPTLEEIIVSRNSFSEEAVDRMQKALGDKRLTRQ